MKKNFICNFILSGLLLLSPLSMFAQRVDSNLPWSVRMVESEMIRCPESWQLDFQPKLKWDYCHGLELQSMLDVYDRYGNRKIYDYALAYADTMVNADGTIKMYKREEYSLDRINSGKFIFRIYEQTKDEKYKKALALMRSQLDEHPRNADENREYCTDVNVIPIDSIYTPIRNVKYQVENFRVEQKTDYEKLVLEITTDGSIHPKEALKEAAKILIYHFMLFSDEKITLESNDADGNEEFDEEVLHMRQLLKTKLVDMDLSVRALNCLKAADVETLGDLVQFNKTDLLKFRNFGKKSLTELDDLLESLNLSFGTDISKYKLDKE